MYFRKFLELMWLLIITGAFQFSAEAHMASDDRKQFTCLSCHGNDVSTIPKLAGQNAEYLVRQLRAFKAGTRQNPAMTSVAANLSDAEMLSLARYFEGLEKTIGSADPALAGDGARVYRGGDPSSGTPACMSCHGPSGAGNPAAGIPALTGQRSSYVVSRLTDLRASAWKGERAIGMMEIARRLSDSDMAAVASYIEGLH